MMMRMASVVTRLGAIALIAAAPARAQELDAVREALWTSTSRAGTPSPADRTWGQGLGRAVGQPAPRVTVAAAVPGHPLATGARVRADGLEAVRLRFPDEESARAFARDYWGRVRDRLARQPGAFYPQALEVRGNELVLLEGPALRDPAKRKAALEAAWTGGPDRPSELTGRSDGTRAEPLEERLGLEDRLANLFREGDRTRPTTDGSGNGVAPSGSSATPSGSSATPSGSSATPGGSSATPGGSSATPGGSSNAVTPAGNGDEAPTAGDPARTWQGVHRGIVLDGVSIPRAGLANRTLRRSLGVAVEPYGRVGALEGKQFVRGKVSHFGGPNDTGVTRTETGALTGERLRSLNTPLRPDAATLAARPRDFYYAAMRYDYAPAGASFWTAAKLLIVHPTTGKAVVVRNVDWGPNTNTRRVIDLSPQALADLGVSTDQEVCVSFADPAAPLGPVR